MIMLDRSYLSAVSMSIFFGASVHAFIYILQTSRSAVAAERLLNQGIGSNSPALTRDKLLRNYLSESVDPAKDPLQAQNQGPSYILEIYADKLRAPLEVGWFIVDLLIRLGLIGTIIGFIIILSSLSAGPVSGAQDLQKMLTTMSGGMGTSLYATLVGLIAATLLTVQYMVLSRSVEHLIAALIKIKDSRR